MSSSTSRPIDSKHRQGLVFWVVVLTDVYKGQLNRSSYQHPSYPFSFSIEYLKNFIHTAVSLSIVCCLVMLRTLIGAYTA